MQMVIGCGRGISGMANNHIKPNVIRWQCAVKCFQTPCYIRDHKKQWSQTFLKNSGSTPTPCLDKAVLAQGGGGVRPKLGRHSLMQSLDCSGYPRPTVSICVGGFASTRLHDTCTSRVQNVRLCKLQLQRVCRMVERRRSVQAAGKW